MSVVDKYDVVSCHSCVSGVSVPPNACMPCTHIHTLIMIEIRMSTNISVFKQNKIKNKSIAFDQSESGSLDSNSHSTSLQTCYKMLKYEGYK